MGKNTSVVNVLLTSAGSGVGEAIYKSLAMSSMNTTIVATDISGFNSGAFRCDKAYKILSPHDPGYTQQIIDICVQQRIDVVLSGSDTELEKLSELNAAKSLDSIIVVGAPEAVKVCRDKRKTCDFYRQRNLPFVDTVIFGGIGEIIRDHGFPILAKPTGGSGSVGVKVLMCQRELDELENKDDYIFQEYLLSENWPVSKAGLKREDVMKGGTLVQKDEISIQVLLGRNREILGTFMSRNVLKFGMPTKIYPFVCDEYEGVARRMALCLADIGMIGPVNLQCKITDRGPVFFEINPRFTGITSVRATLGFKEVEAVMGHMLMNYSAEKVSHLLATDYESACCRYLDEYKFPKTMLEKLETDCYIEN